MKVGDVVHLNSTSPDLTVTNINDDSVHVAWYNEETGKIEETVLPSTSLTEKASR